MDAQTTATQNLVVAVNSVARALVYNAGQFSSITYTGPVSVQIISAPSRLVNVSVVGSGAGTVEFYDTASTVALPPNALMYVLDANAPLGVTQIGVQATDGIAMVVGAGVSVNCTYSVG